MAVLNGFGESGVGSRVWGVGCGVCGAGARRVWGEQQYVITMKTAIINDHVLSLKTC
ncbi:hypothetical protein BJP36_40715 [Moorena producens JHB]|uniref:Uncharacterized protein n=1 Tax=Moorena producens (strain JHB) TaxID=1454205 RepID=A0A9Q9UVC9_MOOP1|nr:hypothetical protein [Moorena producens]WAN68691.1 hypothetical protein BJP36_40715 [Moorena producens JHB]